MEHDFIIDKIIIDLNIILDFFIEFKECFYINFNIIFRSKIDMQCLYLALINVLDFCFNIVPFRSRIIACHF